uniref:No apical meristem-associated C-terminal domain-containing protein n=1 Tax=Cacopsylla melanoneura TaxID=428564 RepID=A0A8D9B7F2_9HEMI
MLDGVMDTEANTEGENNIQPSSDTNDKTTSTIWNRSGYTSGMFSKPRSKLLRTSRSSVGKPASRNYDVQSKNLSKKKDVLELQEQHFLKLSSNQELEKEYLLAKTKREEELHEMDVASRKAKDKREKELFDLAKQKLMLEVSILKNDLGHLGIGNNNE